MIHMLQAKQSLTQFEVGRSDYTKMTHTKDVSRFYKSPARQRLTSTVVLLVPLHGLRYPCLSVFISLLGSPLLADRPCKRKRKFSFTHTAWWEECLVPAVLPHGNKWVRVKKNFMGALTHFQFTLISYSLLCQDDVIVASLWHMAVLHTSAEVQAASFSDLDIQNRCDILQPELYKDGLTEISLTRHFGIIISQCNVLWRDFGFWHSCGCYSTCSDHLSIITDQVHHTLPRCNQRENAIQEQEHTINSVCLEWFKGHDKEMKKRMESERIKSDPSYTQVIYDGTIDRTMAQSIILQDYQWHSVPVPSSVSG